jgi:putative sterol carrier protein
MAGDTEDGKIQVPYPSNKWGELYMDLLNNSPEYEAAALDWEGSMLFVIQPDGGLTPFEIGVWLDLWHGKCRGYQFWVDGQEKPASDFIFSGPERNWLALIAGQLDSIQGLMAGKFKLVGNMTMVMRHAQAAKLLTEILKTFDLDNIVAGPSETDETGAEIVTFRDKDGNPVWVINRRENTFEMLV